MPQVFTLSYFYFPQRVYQAIVQTYASHNSTSAAEVNLSFKVGAQAGQQGNTRIDGLFLARARWDDTAGKIVPTAPEEPYTALPVTEVVPGLEDNQEHGYECPLYRTQLDDAGIRGRPMNFIGSMALACDGDPSVWIKAGVALFLQPPK